jgi:hypothetical protein
MSDFDSYDLSKWVSDGLTHHIDVIAHHRQRKDKRAVNVRLQVSAVAASALLTIFAPWPSMQSQSPLNGAITSYVSSPALRSGDTISGSPLTFWSGIGDQIRSWKVLDDTASPELPPFV